MPLCILIYFIARKVQARNIVLLAFSMLFYAWGEPVWIVMLVAYSFLNYMTNQVSIPVEDIDKAVTALCNNYQNLSKEEKDHLVNNIQLHTKTMVKLLNHVAHFAETETGKEAPND